MIMCNEMVHLKKREESKVGIKNITSETQQFPAYLSTPKTETFEDYEETKTRGSFIIAYRTTLDFS